MHGSRMHTQYTLTLQEQQVTDQQDSVPTRQEGEQAQEPLNSVH